MHHRLARFLVPPLVDDLKPKSLLRMTLVALAVAWPSASRAQEVDPAEGAHHAARDEATARGGGYSASVPLDLPGARGNLPVPVSVLVGGLRTGACGRGCDVPLSFVREDTSFAHRRPVGPAGGTPETRLEVVLSLLGQTMRLVPLGQDWVPQSAPSKIVARKGTSGHWSVHDGDGRTYTFTPALDGLSVLGRIEGPGGARVELDYDIAVETVNPPTNQEGLPGYHGVSIDLSSVSYNHSASGSPKHVVTLVYGATMDQPLAMNVVGEQVVIRRRMLERIEVHGRAEIDGAMTRLARYELHSGVDPDTLLPRLESVTRSGRQGTPEEHQELPVASYEYGSATRPYTKPEDGSPARELRYGATAEITLPAGIFVGFGVSRQHQAGSGRWTLDQELIDVTGDGRADIVFQNPAGTGLKVARGAPSATGPSFPAVLTGTFNDAVLPAQDRLQSFQRRLAVDPYPDDFHDENTEIGNDTMEQLVDVNGDGRRDLVRADELDGYRWVVYLNTPADDYPHNTKWVRKVYDVSRIADELSARNHVLTGGRVPLTRDHTGIELDARICWEYDYATNQWVRKDHQDISSGAYEYWQGEDGIACGPPEVLKRRGKRSMVAWSLVDFNGDQGLDLAFTADRPHTVMIEEPPCYTDPAAPPQPGVPGCRVPPNNHRVAGGLRKYRMQSGGGLRVMFNNQPITSDVPDSEPLDVGGCGIREFTSRRFDNPPDYPEQACELRDINGDQLLDMVQAEVYWHPNTNGLGYRVAYLGTGKGFTSAYLPLSDVGLPSPFPTIESIPCGTNDPEVAEHELRSAYIDVTGDGIQDIVHETLPPFTCLPTSADPEWVGLVAIGTGVGYAPSVRIRSTEGFRLSTEVRVFDTLRYTTRGLYDVDGDGKPELVARHGDNTARVSYIVGPEGPRPMSAGRLVAVENGHGVRTEITYASAKDDGTTQHQVPSPEIVVSEVKTIESPTGQAASTRYAYGNPIFGHDSLARRFRSFGYGRTVALTRVGPGPEPPLIEGNATITDAHGLEPTFATDAARFERLLVAGRTRDVTTLSGVLPATPWSLLTVDVTSDGRAIGSTHDDHESKLWPGPTPATPECAYVDQPYAPDWNSAVFSAMSTCTSRGFLYTSATNAWRGDAAPPASDDNVMTAAEVRAIDDLGRVTLTYLDNDVRVSEDDLCVETTYATPAAAGYPRVLTAIAERRVVQGVDGSCWIGDTLSAIRFEYDHLPHGDVTEGLVTASIVDRYDTETGVLLDTIREFDATHDARGNLLSVTRDSGDGRTWTETTTAFDPFGLVGIATSVDATGAPTLDTSVALDPLTLQPLSVTDANGLEAGLTYDGFGRPVTATVTPPGGTAGALGTTEYLGFEGNDPLGRRIVHKTFDTFVPPAQVGTAPGHVATTYLDAFGRATRTEVDLGSDYAEDLVVGAVAYDAFGRVAFEADPFPVSSLPATVPASAYGTTHFYNTDGTPHCSIRGHGPQSLPTTLFGATDEAQERYPTCVVREFMDGQEVIGVWEPDALLAGSPQAGVQRIAAMTAIGRTVSRSTWGTSARLEHTSFAHDPLGRVIGMTRYRSPGSATVAPSEPVTWDFAYDSLGQLLRQDEPSTVTRHSEYSRWGELVATLTPASGATPEQRQLLSYDGLGRLVHAEQVSGGTVLPETVVDYTYDFAVDIHPALPVTSILGHMASASSATSTAYFAYDTLGRPVATAHEDQDYELYIETLAYADDGAVTEQGVLLPDTGHQAEWVTLEYDSARRLRRARFVDESWKQRDLYYIDTMDALGRTRVAKIGGASGQAALEADYAEQGRRLLQELRLVSASGVVRTLTPTSYDPVGRERGRSEKEGLGGVPQTSVDTVYTYDALGRLAGWSDSNGAARSFLHDALGNVTRHDDVTTALDVALRYRTDNRDQLCSVGYGTAAPATCDVVHDALGRIVEQPTRDGARFTEYLPDGAVSRVARADGTLADFRYGPFGEVQELDITGLTDDPRRDRRYGSIERRDVLQGGSPASMLSRRFSLGDLTASRRGATDDWVFSVGELRGNRFFVDGDGELVQEIDYDAFGQSESTGAQPDSALYSREQWNGGDSLAAFGLSHLGARLYDPVIGRFTSPDPLVLMRTATTSNPFAFANNDPINFADPTGLHSIPTGDEIIRGPDGPPPTPPVTPPAPPSPPTTECDDNPTPECGGPPEPPSDKPPPEPRMYGGLTTPGQADPLALGRRLPQPVNAPPGPLDHLTLDPLTEDGDGYISGSSAFERTLFSGRGAARPPRRPATSGGRRRGGAAPAGTPKSLPRPHATMGPPPPGRDRPSSGPARGAPVSAGPPPSPGPGPGAGPSARATATRPTDGTTLPAREALELARQYLGPGYREIALGVFRSADGTRQVRMTASDLAATRNHGGAPHFNFEQGRLILGPNGRQTFRVDPGGNSHVFIRVSDI